MGLNTPSVIRVTINPNLKYASGSVTGVQNIGTGEGQVYSSTSSNIALLKTIKAGNGVTIVNNTTDITINSSSSVLWGQITGSINDQTDLQNQFLLKEDLTNKSTSTLLGNSNTLYPSQNAVKVYVDTNITASGSTNTFQNIGTGIGEVYESKSGSVVSLRTIKAGNYIEIVNNSNDITISGSGTVPDTRTINTYPLTNNITLSKSDLGLSLVDNTADGDKPLSSASIVALTGKVDSNSAITPGTFTKLVVDSKGLVTSGSVATTVDINDSLNKRYVTDANLVIIGNTSNTNTGDETQSTIKQKLGSASISQDGYLTKENFQIFQSGSLGSNLGIGEGLYTNNSGSTLQLKSLIAGTNISLSSNSTSITINASGGVSEVLWGQITGSINDQTDLQNQFLLKEDLTNKSTSTLLGNSNTLYPSQNAVKVYVDTNITASSSVTTASNIGTGEGEVYASSSGSTLQFKTIKAGTNITITNNVSEITINSTASGSSGTGSLNIANYVLPSFSGLQIISTASIFLASDLGITKFEDCAVIKAQDGLYYMFLDDFTGDVNHDVYCVRSSTPTFTTYTSLGSILTRANSRVGGLTYDPINNEYIMYVTNFISPYSVHAYYIAAVNFPTGEWTDAGVILNTGSVSAYDSVYTSMMSQAIRTASGAYMLYTSSSNFSDTTTRSMWGGFAFSTNPRSSFTKYPGNPVISEIPPDVDYNITATKPMIHTRGILPLSNGYLCFWEGVNASNVYWQVGAMFLDQSLKFAHQIQGSPFFTSTNITYCNPNTVLFDPSTNKAYVYYQSTTPNNALDISIQNVAIFNLLSPPTF